MTDTEINEALVELFAVANAPLTPDQRVQRAMPVLESTGITVEEIVKVIRGEGLRWNEERAKVLGVSTATWQQALTAAGMDETHDLGTLLDAMHRAEAASAMLRAGYTSTTDAAGKLSWTT